jgi:hypothetical protein
MGIQEKRAIRYKAPVEVMDGATPARLGSVAQAIALATLVCFILGSDALLGWASALPINPVSDGLVEAVQEWRDTMAGLGITEFAKSVEALLRAFQSTR